MEVILKDLWVYDGLRNTNWSVHTMYKGDQIVLE